MQNDEIKKESKNEQKTGNSILVAKPKQIQEISTYFCEILFLGNI